MLIAQKKDENVLIDGENYNQIFFSVYAEHIIYIIKHISFREAK